MPALPWLKAPQMLPSCSSSIPTPLPRHGSQSFIRVTVQATPCSIPTPLPATRHPRVIRSPPGPPDPTYKRHHHEANTLWVRGETRPRPPHRRGDASVVAWVCVPPVGDGDEEEAAGAVDGDMEADESGPGEWRRCRGGCAGSARSAPSPRHGRSRQLTSRHGRPVGIMSCKVPCHHPSC